MLLLLYGVHTSSADPKAVPDSDEVATMRRRILAFADQIFDQADTNKDNVLSRDEFAKAVCGEAVALCLCTYVRGCSYSAVSGQLRTLWR